MRGNRVTHLDLSRFGIGGDIDPAIADIDTLVEIDLSNNFISGEIPAALGNLTRLMTLNLAGNRLRGTIPPELADAPALGRLGLQRNRIGGSIPPEFGDAPSLRSLDVSDNLIEGTVPPQLARSGLHELSLAMKLTPRDHTRGVIRVREPVLVANAREQAGRDGAERVGRRFRQVGVAGPLAKLSRRGGSGGVGRHPAAERAAAER